MRLNLFTFIAGALTLCFATCVHATSTSKSSYSSKSNTNSYLSQPTGQYGVGFEDFHWINKDVCPDPLFNGKNKEDFSQENKNYCHEVIVRIYYPTTQHQPRAFYYQPFIKWQQQEFLNQVPSIPKDQINQLSQIKSFSVEKADIVRGEKFPVLFFSPGGGYPVASYENFITELISQGYIVVGINTPFVNLFALPNGHLVKTGSPKDRADIEKKYVPLQAQDLTFVFNKVRTSHYSSSMDLTHIGLFGHSIGARVLADFSHAHPTWVQAAVTMDIGFDTSGASRKKFNIPFMHLISASRKSEPPASIEFELGKNGYLVVVSPNEQNHNFTHHMSFSDLSTLQYLPAYQTVAASLKQQAEEAFDLKLMLHEPTDYEINRFNKSTYVLIKNENKWDIEYFKVQSNQYKGPRRFVNGINEVKGLNKALASLPNKNLKLLSASDIKPIKKVLFSFQHEVLSQPLATGNGWEITDSINTNLIQFFNTFLKGDENLKLKKCLALSKDTLIKCGPGKA